MISNITTVLFVKSSHMNGLPFIKPQSRKNTPMYMHNVYMYIV